MTTEVGRLVMCIYCCKCGFDVQARLTDGSETYPHRPDLYSLPFWKCDNCNNFVGCHHKTKERTRPLGCIPTASLKQARKKVHAIIDPLWQSGKMPRKEIYKALSKAIGREYHTADLRTLAEVDAVISAAARLCT